MKTWPRQWQTLVALFAEKRRGMSESAALADLTGSIGDEFLCPDCGDVFPTLGKLKCYRGKAHKIRRPSARFVRDGVCPHCRVNFHCRTRTMAHLETGARSCREALMNGLLLELTEEELRETDQELVRYRRQARSGERGLLRCWTPGGVGMKSDVVWKNIFLSEFMVVVDQMCTFSAETPSDSDGDEDPAYQNMNNALVDALSNYHFGDLVVSCLTHKELAQVL